VGGTHDLDDLSGFLAFIEETHWGRVVTGLDGSIRVEVAAGDVHP
jgi:hypothetical protein